MLTRTEESSTSWSLIEQARELDQVAWNRLCDVYGPLVYRWARLAGLQDCDAADVGQEVFAVVAGRLGTFDRDIPGATFRGWIRTITRHKVGDFLRKRMVGVQAPGGSSAVDMFRNLCEEVPDDDSSPGCFDRGQSPLVRAMTSIEPEFEPRTWQAFLGTTVESHPVDDLARQLGMSKKAIRQAKYRVLKRLRSELESGSR